MDEQGSYEGFSPGAYGAPVVASNGPPLVQAASAGPAPLLRPLSTGEVLDRTFQMYRHRFWLFAGIAMLPAALLTLTSMIRFIFFREAQAPVAGQAGVPPDVLAKSISHAVVVQAYFLPATLLFVLAYGLSHAATVHAVLQISEGAAASAAASYRAVREHWLRWTGIALRQFWSAFWPVLPGVVAFIAAFALIPRAREASGFAMLGLLLFLAGLFLTAGLVLGLLNFLRVALAMPAGVQEQICVGAALRRSRTLVAGRKGRIFLALLMVYVLQMVAGVIQLPLVFLALRVHGAQQVLLQSIQLLVQFVSATLVSPIASIALCLFYVDERVRREGYDIEVLMQRVSAPGVRVEEAQPLA